MRKINIGTKHTTEVIAIDDNTYIINTTDSDHSMPLATIRFNDETVNCNGVFVNDLLVICIDRLGEQSDAAKVLESLIVQVDKKSVKKMKKLNWQHLSRRRICNIPDNDS